jgi:hypothetical protein
VPDFTLAKRFTRDGLLSADDRGVNRFVFEFARHAGFPTKPEARPERGNLVRFGRSFVREGNRCPKSEVRDPKQIRNHETNETLEEGRC